MGGGREKETKEKMIRKMRMMDKKMEAKMSEIRKDFPRR